MEEEPSLGGKKAGVGKKADSMPCLQICWKCGNGWQ